MAVLSIYLQPVLWRAAQFRVPCTPFFPCLGMLTNIFLIASLGSAAYVRFGVWLLISLAFYMFYSVHIGSSTPSQYRGLHGVELTENHGDGNPDQLQASIGRRVGGAVVGKAGAGAHPRSPHASDVDSLGSNAN